ncbi:hypothetical protein P691DRAFT_803797 [Macrolepiota fuliginosa MF-IS2]|uniref:Uncharacterized protein n=1 Tax=Macrolepiota fuliginosa MF-IS2 TaxID=1400762 RepID=A0A9P6C915_9AGAR|nr:hypothetical protein P691DRAFT_803797 [Macrolepiota fuliginosa MF-IS2]
MAETKTKASSLHPSHNHASKPSVDTNASGFAESAISYSAFPEPPSSIPVTPIRSVFGPPSPGFTNYHIPAHPRYGSPQITAGSITSSSNRFSRSTFDRDSTHAPTFQHTRQDNDVNSVSASNISPYDWHEGASSIGVDATEDKLLPTSFITSLLQENVGPRGANRASYSSDAFSGISEMTYPPRNPHINFLRDSSAGPSQHSSRRQSTRVPLARPVGGRPPSSFQPWERKRGTANSDDHESPQPTSAALPSGSHPDHSQKMPGNNPTPTPTAEQSEPSSKFGGRLAVYEEVDESDGVGHHDANSSLSGLAVPETRLIPQRPVNSADVDSPIRTSMHSSGSVGVSLISRIPSLRSIRRVLTRRRKPLPPVPTIPHIPIAKEREHRKLEEQAPLPDLVNRANYLHGLLEKGYHPHQSISSYPTKSEYLTSSFDDAETIARYRREYQTQKPPHPFHSRAIAWSKSKKGLWIICGVFVVIVIIAVGSAVGVTAQRNRDRKSHCPTGLGGASCNLNATCVCTTSSPCGHPLAQAILDLIPITNDQLSTNLTTSAVYASLLNIQEGVQGSSCVQQVNLIDVNSALDSQRYPNRTKWAKTALLWTLTQTQDPGPVTQLQTFIKEAPWTQLPNDGPIGSAGSTFTASAAGFNYDFAAQIIKPPSAGSVAALDEQISRVDPQIRPSLEFVYGYATACSEQQDRALSNYWTTVLHQSEDRLGRFKSAFSASPIIIPFDATSQSLRNLYTSDTFPPPTACYPGLQPDQREIVSAVEEKAFNLASATNTTTQFDAGCFPLHPTYGVLDILRLRLPLLDSRNNTAQQGVTLKSNIAPRAILAVGGALSSLPELTNATRSPTALADPRNYGTTTYANHIIFQYLSSVSTNTANAIISHVLDSPTSPPLPPNPTNESALFSLDSIPVLEVAVFGNVEASDADSYVSAFTTPSGSLFFGSDDGSAFRTWAIGRGGQISWTENATSPGVVHDNTFSDLIFNQTWTATSAAINSSVGNVGLINITTAFQYYQRFGP